MSQRNHKFIFLKIDKSIMDAKRALLRMPFVNNTSNNDPMI